MLLALVVAGFLTGSDSNAWGASTVSPLVISHSRPTSGFTAVSARDAGVTFTNPLPPERFLTNHVYLNGSGVALGDVNGDQRADVFLAGLQGSSTLFFNLGDWKFAAASGESLPPVTKTLDITGAVLVDLDGDGDLDLVVNTTAQGTHLWFNDGKGQFSAPNAGPLNTGRAGTSLALADADGDGDLDLYVVNYRPTTIRDDPTGKFVIRNEASGPRVITYNGRSTSEPDLVGRFYVTPAGVKETGEPDAFFLNDGRGQFSPVSWTGGAFLNESGKPLEAAPYDWGLSVLFRDLNGDGRPDLYLSNDFESPDRLWFNETEPGGPVRFRAASRPALRHISAFAMGADAADINRDGYDDFVVLDMLSRDHRERNVQVDNLPLGRHQPGIEPMRPQFLQNTLFLGRGDGTFAEIARLAGLAASEWSWTPVFLDVDLDGWEDLLVSNGHELDMMDADVVQQADALRSQRRLSPREMLDLRKLFRRFDAPNAAFRNRGNLSFSDETTTWGFGLRNVTQGMALADLDGDGDLDVVQNNLNAAPTLLRNDAGAPRLLVRARGAGANSQGIGARIRVFGGPVPEQSQVLMSGGRYLSSDDPVRVFAAGPALNLVVEVSWPSGKRTRVSDVPPNSLVEVAESDAVESSGIPPAAPVPLLEDVSARLNHVSGETAFNDFDRQPLLPWSLAYPAPGATWADLDGDGVDELLIGTGAGGVPAVFQLADSEFRRLTQAPLQKVVPRELTTLLTRGGTIFAGSSNYRDGRTNGGVLRLYDLERNVSGESLLGHAFGVGPLAQADVDGEGDLEIFVGGRATAGRYPESAGSLLLKTAEGRFVVAQRFPELGLVNGATLADLDEDGDADLLVALEWGPLCLRRNEAGSLVAWDPEIKGPTAGLAEGRRLSSLAGWWTSVAVGDFDSDGRLDFVAGNRGWNWFPVPRAPQDLREPAPENLRRMRYGDFSGTGRTECVESYVTHDLELPLRRADVWFAVFPQLHEVYPNRNAFGAAALADVLAALRWPVEPPLREAAWFASAVFLNRGDHFEYRTLPVEAQFTPVAGMAVADFDGDGQHDVFLAQNFFPVREDEAPQDAGVGLLLRGDGTGGFVPLSAPESGVVVSGDARAAAVGDFDQDGRPDLVVTQNAGPTRLFHNRTGKPGIRVRLAGRPENPTGIGTRLRLRKGEWGGPAQEIQSGSGWLSVDSPQRVLTGDREATHLEVRWPGAPPALIPLPPGVQELEVSWNGSIRVVR